MISNLRQLMTKEIRTYGWLDYCYKRGDDKADTFKGQSGDEWQDYENWLNTLEDDDFLATYNRTREAEGNLD